MEISSMANSDTQLFLYDTKTAQRDSEVEIVNGEPYFPEHVRGWSDVLDCRHPPYTEKSIEDNCHFADHVHKPFILVNASDLAKQTPPTET
ncbi:MAG: hypothetical protein VYE40_08860 [Myxococcota bacterium]|jgi:hypothetical protein|nr:hypothetical protein [Myxococcota bacterium]